MCRKVSAKQYGLSALAIHQPSNPTVPMPNPTLKDIVPLLDVLNRDIKFSRVIKHDLYGRASMFKTLNELNAMDIESMVIETLNLGLPEIP